MSVTVTAQIVIAIGHAQIQEFLLRARDINHAATSHQIITFVAIERSMDVLRNIVIEYKRNI